MSTLLGATLVALSAATSQTHAAASSPPLVSAVHGIEIVAEHTQGTFSGYTTGSLPGGWLATVKHTPLQPNATITGGTLTLITDQTQFKRPLTGRFTSGTITNTNPGANCTNQTFHVIGNLAHFTGNRTGRFTITLTHHRHIILGTCLTYFATVTGTLTLTR